MYQTIEFQVNKTRNQYITILSHIYPNDKSKFKHYPYNRLRAIYIKIMNRRLNEEK